MKIRTLLLTTLMMTSLAGCDDAAPRGAEAEDADARGGVGKADHLEGSCAADDQWGPSCGGPAPVGNCWCDEACEDYGDCCVDSWDECGVGEPQPEVSQCLADEHCEPGQVCAGGACIELPSCDDGTALHPLCDIKPGCDEGQIAAVQNGCFACVDEVTCEPPPVDCDDGTSLHPLCDIKPACAEGEVAAVQNSCFACVDAQTCD